MNGKEQMERTGQAAAARGKTAFQFLLVFSVLSAPALRAAAAGPAAANFDGAAAGAGYSLIVRPIREAAAKIKKEVLREARRTVSLRVSLYDGQRELLPAGPQVLLTVIDAAGRVVVRDYYRAPHVVLRGIPYYDDGSNHYSVIAWAPGYRQGGFFPVSAAPGRPGHAAIMLLSNHPRLDFAQAGCSELSAQAPDIWRVLSAGAKSEAAACGRWQALVSARPKVAACLLNITEAMSRMPIERRTVLSYVRRILWKGVLAPKPAQDRFFAVAGGGLLDELKSDPELRKSYAPEFWPGFFHHGAIYSWKQTTFGVANVQLTVHPYQSEHFSADRTVPIILEPDIDYYKDSLAHFFLEVIPNAVTGGLTDPVTVYQLRWMAVKNAGLKPFDPYYTVH